MKVPGAYNPRQAKARVGDWEKMVLNPWGCRTVRTPSQSPFTGACRMFTRTITVDSAGAGDRFSIVSRPHLQNTLSLNRSSPIVVPAAGTIINKSFTLTDDLLNVGGLSGTVLAGEMDALDISGDKLGEIETDFDQAAGVCYYPFVTPAAFNFDLNVNAKGLSVQVYYRSAGTWVGAATASLLLNSVTTNVTLPNAGDGIVIAIHKPSSSSGSFSLSGFSSAPGISASACFDTFSTDALTLGKVSAHRVTALSVLATFTGNQFNDGGVVAAARTRSGYYYEGPGYESLTRLTDHRYWGKAKEGAYAWWLPYSYEELEFKRPYDDIPETEIRMAGIFDDADGSFQLTVSMVVEFYSPLQIFEHKIGPPLSDDFETAYHALDSAPAATCNPAHTKIIKSLVNKAATTAKGAAKTVVKHPELLAALLAAA